MKENERDTMSLAEMAKELGITSRSLQNRIYLRKNHPPCFRTAAGKYQFPVKDYIRWRESRMIRAIA